MECSKNVQHCICGIDMSSRWPFYTQTLQKIRGVIQGLQKKLMGQEVQRQTLSQQLQDNTRHLHSLQSHVAAVDDKSSLISQVKTNTF